METSQTQSLISGILLAVVLVTFLLAICNVSGIVIDYHHLVDEIQEIPDPDIRCEFLQELDNKLTIFCKKVLFHNEADCFKSRKGYNMMLNYRLGTRKISIFDYHMIKGDDIVEEEVGYAKEKV